VLMVNMNNLLLGLTVFHGQHNLVLQNFERKKTAEFSIAEFRSICTVLEKRRRNSVSTVLANIQ